MIAFCTVLDIYRRSTCIIIVYKILCGVKIRPGRRLYV